MKKSVDCFKNHASYVTFCSFIWKGKPHLLGKSFSSGRFIRLDGFVLTKIKETEDEHEYETCSVMRDEFIFLSGPASVEYQ